MSENHMTEYLLLLKNPSASAVQSAQRKARQCNLIVSSVFKEQAIIVLSDSERPVNELFDTRLFQLKTKKAVPKKIWAKLKGDRRAIVLSWNHRFSKSYKAHRQKRLQKGPKSWGAQGVITPAYYFRHDSGEVMRRIRQSLDDQGIMEPKESFEELLKKHNIVNDHLVLTKIVELLRRWLRGRYHTQMTGLVYRAATSDLSLIFGDREIAENANTIVSTMEADMPCRKLHGRISIGLIFVDSNTSINRIISASDKQTLELDIRDGLSWLTTEHPSGNLSFVYNNLYAVLDVQDQGNSPDGASSSYDAYWWVPAMETLTFNGQNFSGDNVGIASLKQALMNADGADDAVLFFITRYGSSWTAYSTGERFIALTEFGDDWRANGVRDFTNIGVHELMHQFGASDEYTGTSGTPCSSCEELHGCDMVPNGNCEACSLPRRRCIMESTSVRQICQWTRAHVGWADLFVELFTDDELYSGTDDDVWLDIGQNPPYLMNVNHDERSRSYRDGYAIWDGGHLPRSAVKRLLIRKEEDRAGGGWKLQRLRVYHDGELLCDESPAVWLKNYDRFYLSQSYANDEEFVNELSLRVITSNAPNSGTDNRVTLSLAGRTWRIQSTQNDFGRNSDRTYRLDPGNNLRVADLSSIQINKSPDGVGGGWKLAGLVLFVNGQAIYENYAIETWLRNDDREFREMIP